MNIEKLDTGRHDLQLVSELIYETDTDLFRIFLDEDRQKAIEKLQKLIVAGRNPYGHENIHVAEDENGQAVGILVAYRGDEIKFRDEAKVYMDTMNFLQFLKLTLVKPIFDRISASSIKGDDYYIGNIAVNPDVRGKGTGTFLLKQSFQIARKKNCKRMVLDVLFYNRKARAWYEKHGFTVYGEKNFKWFGLEDGTWGMECLL
ncbi:GNAT family N-acetyltransferase [Methanobacterium aggregans]|uniref:GNAT family N-acetyltransferase n=1 Tax=Methanobacterium aggregans TaxID=1615586 RepID=UPI001AEA09E4|nr:GNAT family N-acetyltransferase [Methanobacterium aggregans]MBP2045811.1 ribosomal protein S18 acetylase RimI-like enzyme [Methanobacterium aggregans]